MGSKKRTTTQTYTPPSWVEANARQAQTLGSRIGNQSYTPYTGERVAGLSQNEQMGTQLARTTAGSQTPYFNQSRALAERGTQQFTDANMQDYMNPYIHAALDPAARKIREQGAMNLNELDSRASSMNAFGGSRAALLRSEAQANTQESISDLYKTGMSDAYDRAVSIWGDERARDMMASGQIMQLGDAVKRANTIDINALMNTGAVDRSIRQALADFDYQQFTENRDWDVRNLSGLLAALQGTKGSYTTTQTTEQQAPSNMFGQILGLAATVFGGMFAGPAGAGGGAALSGGGSEWVDMAVDAGVS